MALMSVLVCCYQSVNHVNESRKREKLMNNIRREMKEIRDGYVSLESLARQVLTVDPDSKSAKETVEMVRGILSRLEK